MNMFIIRSEIRAIKPIFTFILDFHFCIWVSAMEYKICEKSPKFSSRFDLPLESMGSKQRTNNISLVSFKCVLWTHKFIVEFFRLFFLYHCLLNATNKANGHFFLLLSKLHHTFIVYSDCWRQNLINAEPFLSFLNLFQPRWHCKIDVSIFYNDKAIVLPSDRWDWNEFALEWLVELSLMSVISLCVCVCLRSNCVLSVKKNIVLYSYQIVEVYWSI